MIKQKFGKESPHKRVYDITTALIRFGINSMPSLDTMIKFLDEERESINPLICREVLKECRSLLRKQLGKIKQSKSMTPKSASKTSAKKKSQRSSDSDGQTDDDDDDDEDDDLCLRLSHLFKREAMKEQQQSRNKSKDENESYILQRLKDSAMKLTQDQFYALVEYHLGEDKVILMQLEAAEIIRQSVDSEFHSLFDLPHTSNSAIKLLHISKS
jgi:hypothetical protein